MRDARDVLEEHAIEAAVIAEREACAQVAETNQHISWNHVTQGIATAIRARGDAITTTP